MTNPVSENRELARILVDRCDSILELFYENAITALGCSAEETTIDTTELMNNVDTINGIRELRRAIVEGATGTLFARHRTALMTVMEMSLDMES